MSRERSNTSTFLSSAEGPPGMAAAARAAECGVRVGIVDDNFRLGGQIWRGEWGDARVADTRLGESRSNDSQSDDGKRTEASLWAGRVRASGATALCGLRVVHQPDAGVLLAENLDGFCELSYENLVLATGARERFLPFPGWTLPNVMGAGGLQAMVKSGLPIRGKRVVVAGTGPLLLAVAAYLRKHGAEIPVICEQASWSSLAKFGLALPGWPEKIVQALQLKRDLAGVPFAANSWPLAAHGQQTLESVIISRAGKNENYPLRLFRLWVSSDSKYRIAVVAGLRGPQWLCASRRFSDHDGPLDLLRWRTDQHWRRGVGARGRTDCRSGCGRPPERSKGLIRQAPEGAPLCAAARSHVPPALGTGELAFARNHCLPLRRCFVFASSPAPLLARRQAAYALRHGPVPGTSLRPRHAIPFQLESGFHSAARVPRSR